jgi:DNA-binding NarL/FixJ family response regulator
MSEDLIRICDGLSLQEKVIMRDYLSDTIKTCLGGVGKSPLRASMLMREMASIMEIESISYESRFPSMVWARSMVAYQMIREGYTTEEIAFQLGKVHSSVTHMKKKMMDVFDLPQAYRDILTIWNEFQMRIQDDIHN